MKHLQLSEKTKDRILNAALVGSLLLLASGYVRPQTTHSPVQPTSASTTVHTLRQLPPTEAQPYKELPLVRQASVAQSPQQTPSQPSDATVAKGGGTSNPVSRTTPTAQLTLPKTSHITSPFTTVLELVPRRLL